MIEDSRAGPAASSDPRERPADSLTAALWNDAADIFQKIVAHPFLGGLSDGTLAPETFVHFLEQDSHYLRAYTQCLATLAGRAPEDDVAAMLLSHAGSVALETALHSELAAELGWSDEPSSAVPPSPTTEAYRNALLVSADRGSFLEGLAALLPCYWIYARVGHHLLRTGSPNPVYSRWIENYSGGDYEQAVTEVLACADSLGRRVGPAERGRALGLYRRGAQYEWMFWDACYRREVWPV